MKTRKLLVILSATALLSSCGLYNKYERPEVNTQGLVRDPLSDKDTLVAADTANFGNMPWKEVFTDPQLQQLIQQGLDHNTDLLNAALNVKMMQAQLMTAKLAFIPAISFSPSGTLSSWNNQTPSKIYSLPVQASWSIDLFGNLLSVKRSAQMQLLAMKDYQTMVKTNIISGIANVYYTLLMLDKQQQIVDEMVGLTEETWNVMKLQKELGRARSTSVQSAEASHYMVKAQAADLKRQIKETENALCLLLGQPGQKIERGNLESQSLPTTLSAGVPLQLLNNRADVHYAEMQLAACYHDVQTARSRFYPSITISGSGAFTNSGGMGIVNPGKWLLSAVRSLTQPIFMNGRLVAGLKVAKAQQEQAYNTWQNAILKAGNEVSNALVAYNTSAEKAELEAKQVALYTQTVADTRQLYTSSGASYLEVISAQSNLLNAQLSKVADEFYKMQAVVSLYSALGGGRD